MFWLIANTLGFVGTPAGLIWGWIAWARGRQDQTRARDAISLGAMSAVSLSLLLFFVARFLSPVASRTFDKIGFFVAVGGAVISLAGHLRLVIPVCLVTVGAIMLWYGLTLR
jgi:hypothetical protein